jgi:hypothetical protein
LLASLRISYSSPRVAGGIINVRFYSAEEKNGILIQQVKTATFIHKFVSYDLIISKFF